MSYLFCPECSKALDPGAYECGCGWSEKPKKAARSTKPIPQTNQVCAWMYQDKRCPMPGSVNIAGRWMCGGHGITQGNQKAAIAYFDKIDEVLKGKATDAHDFAVAAYADATHWDVDEHRKEILVYDKDALIQAKRRAPQWFKWCTGMIRSLVWKDLEKYARGLIDLAELRKRLGHNDLPAELKATPTQQMPDTSPKTEDEIQAEKKRVDEFMEAQEQEDDPPYVANAKEAQRIADEHRARREAHD